MKQYSSHQNYGHHHRDPITSPQGQLWAADARCATDPALHFYFSAPMIEQKNRTDDTDVNLPYEKGRLSPSPWNGQSGYGTWVTNF